MNEWQATLPISRENDAGGHAGPDALDVGRSNPGVDYHSTVIRNEVEQPLSWLYDAALRRDVEIHHRAGKRSANNSAPEYVLARRQLALEFRQDPAHLGELRSDLFLALFGYGKQL
ncbi:hypothetical protein FQZ97_804790 [compost metagenome]